MGHELTSDPISLFSSYHNRRKLATLAFFATDPASSFPSLPDRKYLSATIDYRESWPQSGSDYGEEKATRAARTHN
jgi:hypothetical protein